MPQIQYKNYQQYKTLQSYPRHHQFVGVFEIGFAAFSHKYNSRHYHASQRDYQKNEYGVYDLHERIMDKVNNNCNARCG